MLEFPGAELTGSETGVYAHERTEAYADHADSDIEQNHRAFAEVQHAKSSNRQAEYAGQRIDPADTVRNIATKDTAEGIEQCQYGYNNRCSRRSHADHTLCDVRCLGNRHHAKDCTKKQHYDHNIEDRGRQHFLPVLVGSRRLRHSSLPEDSIRPVRSLPGTLQ